MEKKRKYDRWNPLGPTLLVWVLAWSQAAVASPAVRIVSGAGSFSFVDDKGDATKEMTVYTYLPRHVKASKAPVVFIMHGHQKNAKGSRDEWAQYAEKYGFMVLAPLFDQEQWAGNEYSYASVVGKDGKVRDKSMWSFSVIEHLFDAVKAATGNANSRYFLYGFSEGGQFVHRLVLLLPEARYARAVIGTPGWYTMPKFDVKFPYGLGGVPLREDSLKMSFGRDVVLMLGDQDTDPNDPELRKTRQAMAQGAHRFERGETFFREARGHAAELKAAFAWRLVVVPGAGHDKRMFRPAAAVLMGH
jgi:poly(3-hydroxybutyrate) depolymerase